VRLTAARGTWTSFTGPVLRSTTRKPARCISSQCAASAPLPLPLYWSKEPTHPAGSSRAGGDPGVREYAAYQMTAGEDIDPASPSAPGVHSVPTTIVSMPSSHHFGRPRRAM
jgi:hypothetical protein